MKKRGTSHIEMVLAFVLFIGAVIAVFFIFNPLENKSNQNYPQTYLFNKIFDTLKADVTSYTIIINASAFPPSQQARVITLSLGRDVKNQGICIENYSGAILPANKSGNNVSFSWHANNGSIIKIYASEDINSSYLIPNKPSSDEPNYTISSYNLIEAISENKVNETILSYQSSPGYLALKKKLSFYEGVNFAFELIIPGAESIKASRKIPKGMAVNSLERSVQIIRNDGGLVYGTLEVQIW
jgi:hypothetical protein